MSVFVSLWLLSISAPTAEDMRRALDYQYQERMAEQSQQIEQLKEALATKQADLGQCLAQSEQLNKNIIRSQSEAQAAERDLRALRKKMSSLSSQAAESRNPTTANTKYQEALTAVGYEKWDEALLLFESVARNFPSSTQADNAVYWMGKIYLHKKEPELALEEFNRLLQLYPKSERTLLARNEVEKLNGSQNVSLP